jgi:cobalt/nickel transport system permease protein
MHIPDGYFSLINPTTHAVSLADVAVLAVTWAVTVPFLVFAWRKTKSAYSQSIAATLAVMSALVFVAQILNFPVAGGTSVHILGGTLLALVLGPFPAMLSMTIVLIMQAVFFADGGLLTFGANALNMAVIGGLSFYIVKLLASKSVSGKRFAVAVFAAAFAASVLSGLFTGVEIGLSQAYAGVGGLSVTVPAMLVWYSVEGLAEASVTMLLVGFLGRVQPALVVGLRLLRGGGKL